MRQPSHRTLSHIVTHRRTLMMPTKLICSRLRLHRRPWPLFWATGAPTNTWKRIKADTHTTMWIYSLDSRSFDTQPIYCKSHLLHFCSMYVLCIWLYLQWRSSPHSFGFRCAMLCCALLCLVWGAVQVVVDFWRFGVRHLWARPRHCRSTTSEQKETRRMLEDVGRCWKIAKRWKMLKKIFKIYENPWNHVLGPQKLLAQPETNLAHQTSCQVYKLP